VAEQDATPLPPPPPLPPGLADPVPAIVVGTALWFLALVVVLLFGPDDTVLAWTCLTGGVLGIIGYGIFTWQRSAARRGKRTAQQGQGLD
jgi:ammonia channel protein AmtB